MVVTATAFVCAVGRGTRPSFRRGFGAAALGSVGFVAFLLVWVYAARNQLVQLPFEHFDVQSSGAANVAGYLAAMALAGTAYGRVRGRVAAGTGQS